MANARSRVVLFVLAIVLTAASSLLVAKEGTADRFFIVGYVTNPGSYSLDEGTTVGKAIDRAGGFSAGRHISGVEIIRLRDGQKRTFAAMLGDRVQPDDTIRVK